MAALRKSSNNRNKENEFREGGGVAERQAFPPKDPAARKVSYKPDARLWVGSVQEGGSSTQANAKSGTERTSPHCLLPTRAGACRQGCSVCFWSQPQIKTTCQHGKKGTEQVPRVR